MNQVSLLARATATLTVLTVGGSALLALAPASHARGYADCYSASGSFNDRSNYFEVNIDDKCGPISTSDEAFGQRVDYQFSMGFGGFCASRSGSLSVGRFGTSFRVPTSCLSPGYYRPEIKFSNYSDGSSNFVYLASIRIPEPDPEPAYTLPTPTPTPTQTTDPIGPSAIGPTEANQEDCMDWSMWAGDALPVTDPRCAMSTSAPVTAKPASPKDAWAVLVEWQPVTSNDHRLRYYRVLTSPPTCGSYGECPWEPSTDPALACPHTTATGCIVRGLNAGPYEFWVQAVPLFGPVTVSGPSNAITLPLAGVKVSKYQQYATLANNVIVTWVDETNKLNAAEAAQTFTSAPALRVSSRVAKEVCKNFRKANRKGGISKSELKLIAEVVWTAHEVKIDLMTGTGIPPEDIDSGISAQAIVMAAGVQTYCPKYSSVYIQRIMKITRKEFNKYMDLDG